MNGRTERAFLPTLRAVEGQLPTPLPKRMRLLRELECDLEALSEALIAEGIPRPEAEQRAVEALVPDPAVLRELIRLHRPAYARFTHDIAGDRLRVLERTALGLATALVVAVGAGALLQADLLSHRSPFLVPVLALGAMLIGLILMKVFQLWVKADHRRPDVGLKTILGLSGVILVVAFLGSVLDFYQVAGRLEASPEFPSQWFLEWMAQDAGLLSVALTLAMFGGLSWFALNHWLALIWTRHREVLGHPRPMGYDDKPHS